MVTRESDPTPTRRVALIGCGRIGSLADEESRHPWPLTHAGAVAASGRAELAVVCDVDPARAEHAAQAWAVPQWETNPSRALAEGQVDLVIIATPPEGRVPLIEAAVQSGATAIVCEKPLAASAAEAHKVRALLRNEDVYFAVNYTRRWAPVFSDLQQAVAPGGIGPITTVVAHYGGGLANNGSHMIDLLNGLFGPPSGIDAVQVVDDDRTSNDRTISCVLSYGTSHGPLRAHLIGHDHRAHHMFELDLVGATGRIRMLDAGNVVERYEVSTDPRYNWVRSLRRTSSHDDRLQSALSGVLDEALEATTDDSVRPRCGVEDACASLDVVDAICRAAPLNGPGR